MLPEDSDKKLQSQAIDVFYAYNHIKPVLSTLQSMRDNSDREYHKIFEEATSPGRSLHGEDYFCLPPITRCQSHCSNNQVSNPEDYYKITLYKKFLSQVVAEINKSH